MTFFFKVLLLLAVVMGLTSGAAGSATISNFTGTIRGAGRADRETLTNSNIHDAVRLWFNDEAAALSRFGDIEDWVMGEVTSLAHLFRGWQNAGPYRIGKWDVSRVTNFDAMAMGAFNFNADLSEWDVRNGLNFDHMFRDTKSFDGVSVADWNVAKGYSFERMFSSAMTFNGDISGWDVRNGANFQYMFQMAKMFNADISMWDVSSGKKFYRMFHDAFAFKHSLCWSVDRIGVNIDEIFLGVPSATWDTSCISTMGTQCLTQCQDKCGTSGGFPVGPGIG